jgi:hypothetical protein
MQRDQAFGFVALTRVTLWVTKSLLRRSRSRLQLARMSEEAPMDEVEKLKQLAAEATEEAAGLRSYAIAKDIADRLEAAFPGRKFGILSERLRQMARSLHR